MDEIPAFPSSHMQHEGGGTMLYPGMTLRDWFAGQTLAGMLAHPQADYHPFGSVGLDEPGVDKLASEAYRLADAMLAERAK